VRGYEVVIGFRNHAQLSTASKIFSRASTAFGAEPNTQACAVDLALPGTLPVMNKGAVERAIRVRPGGGFARARAQHLCAQELLLPRPAQGLPDQPVRDSRWCRAAGRVFSLGDEKKSVRLVRAHLEEDAGKSLHEDFIGQTGIDLNRAGTPLLEIVTEPDMRSSAEAVAYAKELHKIVTWIGICDGNMQEGSFRCDANVSVRKPGAPLGTRREIKNLNSFKFMQQAIDFTNPLADRADRRRPRHPAGHRAVQPRHRRDPRHAHQGRRGRLPLLPRPRPAAAGDCAATGWSACVRSEMAELPRVMAQRFVADYGLPEYDATTLTQSKAMAAYFEAVAKACGQPKLASNWVMGEISRRTAWLCVFSSIWRRTYAGAFAVSFL
jgi:aspartyl-tRNA(Asn)/glutamyl-tRNA(Gln) amidotransferase subunit B